MYESLDSQTECSTGMLRSCNGHPRHRLGHQHHAAKMPRFPLTRRGLHSSTEVLHLICESSPPNTQLTIQTTGATPRIFYFVYMARSMVSLRRLSVDVYDWSEPGLTSRHRANLRHLPNNLDLTASRSNTTIRDPYG